MFLCKLCLDTALAIALIESVGRSLVVDDHLQSSGCQEATTVYHYCDYSEPATLEPMQIYRMILKQLFYKNCMSDSAIETVVDKLKYNPNGLDEEELANLILSIAQSCRDLRLFVDGLDECAKPVQQNIITFFRNLTASGHSSVKILVTCRDEGYLLKDLSQYRQVRISPEASIEDIKFYISNTVNLKLSSGALCLGNMALRQEIVSTLVAKAQGM